MNGKISDCPSFLFITAFMCIRHVTAKRVYLYINKYIPLFCPYFALTYTTAFLPLFCPKLPYCPNSHFSDSISLFHPVPKYHSQGKRHTLSSFLPFYLLSLSLPSVSFSVRYGSLELHLRESY